MIVATAALAILLSGCGPQVADTTYVTSSDPELGARVAALLPDLAARAKMELVKPIRAERRTREELESYLLHKLDEEFPPEEAALLTQAYSLVGLVDPGLDLRGLLASVYQEQVAGFYDPDSTALFVMDDMPEEMLEGVLIHELVHAVQDQTANLDSLTAEERGNDHQAAAQSAIEGHATLIMMEYMAEQQSGQPVDLSQLPDISQLLGPAMEALRDQYPALSSAPKIIQEALLFPYLRGYSFVSALWQAQEGRPAPFGPNLPQSTEQILRPSLAFGPEPDMPTDLELELDPGFEILYGNTFGQGEFEVLLEEHLGPDGRALARGWDGDRYALVRGPSGTEGLIWISVWDSPEERDGFVQGFRAAAAGFPTPGTLEETEVLERPGAVLRIGVPAEISVEVREKAGG
ncbi:MAG: hypothetical protein HKO65_18405 [Gemmatimonadetes bacterium]|nr:hypothetical protein [Gemmatimonadota bacterium]NNM07071.1 hypothetical protein [Gemmatimonadota bacterium]